MKLIKAQITNYRSVKDSGWIEFENNKTILVGPNEAGKTAILRALQQINPPDDVLKLDALRDYPRSQYNDISTNKIDPSSTPVVTAHFELDAGDQAAIEPEFRVGSYVFQRRLDNSFTHWIVGMPAPPLFGPIKKDALRLAAHVDGRNSANAAAETFAALTKDWSDTLPIKEQPCRGANDLARAHISTN